MFFCVKGKKKMEDIYSEQPVVGELGLPDTNRRVTRSVTRALERKVVGSLFD